MLKLLSLSKSTFWITVGALLIGFALGYASTQFRFFELDYKIAVMEVVSLFTSIAIGIYVATKITSHHSAKRFLVELLVEDLRESKKSISEIRMIVNGSDYTLDRIVPSLSEFSKKIVSLELISVESRLLEKNRFQGFHIQIRHLRRLLTFNGQPNSQSYRLGQRERLAASSRLNLLESELNKMLLEINSR